MGRRQKIPQPEKMNTPTQQARRYLNQVRHVRRLFFDHHASIEIIARQTGWPEDKVRRIVQGKEAGSIGWDL